MPRMRTTRIVPDRAEPAALLRLAVISSSEHLYAQTARTCSSITSIFGMKAGRRESEATSAPVRDASALLSTAVN